MTDHHKSDFEVGSNPSRQPRFNLQRLLRSDGFIGALIALLTIATALATYRAAVVEIRGEDLEFESQRLLSRSNLLLVQNIGDFMNDAMAYDAYNLVREDDPLLAEEYLDRVSDLLLEGIERPGGPFDEVYEQARFQESFDLIQEANEIEIQANFADDLAIYFQMAQLILTVGLASAAWASLVDESSSLRLLFTFLGLMGFMVGMMILSFGLTQGFV